MTRRLRIFRGTSADTGTVGVLDVDGSIFCYTLELPWRRNVSNLSSIPAGRYRMLWTLSPRFRRHTYEIVDVPRRAGIRVHAGNLAGDSTLGFDTHSHGCPLVGKQVGALRNRAGAWQRAVLQSAFALAALEAELDGQPCDLEVIEL